MITFAEREAIEKAMYDKLMDALLDYFENLPDFDREDPGIDRAMSILSATYWGKE